MSNTESTQLLCERFEIMFINAKLLFYFLLSTLIACIDGGEECVNEIKYCDNWRREPDGNSSACDNSSKKLFISNCIEREEHYIFAENGIMFTLNSNILVFIPVLVYLYQLDLYLLDLPYSYLLDAPSAVLYNF